MKFPPGTFFIDYTDVIYYVKSDNYYEYVFAPWSLNYKADPMVYIDVYTDKKVTLKLFIFCIAKEMYVHNKELALKILKELL